MKGYIQDIAIYYKVLHMQNNTAEELGDIDKGISKSMRMVNFMFKIAVTSGKKAGYDREVVPKEL